jgi:hypothetical protein
MTVCDTTSTDAVRSSLVEGLLSKVAELQGKESDDWCTQNTKDTFLVELIAEMIVSFFFTVRLQETKQAN